MRFPNQQGDAETSSQDQVIWHVDENGNRVNVLKMTDRQVVCIEGMPEPRLMRALIKLEGGVVMDDPAPDMRAREKTNLMWNRLVAPLAAGALTPRIALPAGWTRIEHPTDSLAVFAAQRGEDRMELAVDRAASQELGLDGYAHQVAARLQRNGRNVYVQTDVDFARPNVKMYQHTFTQMEGTEEIAYYLGVVDLGQGMGYLRLSGPDVDESKNLEKLFYELLNSMQLVVEPGGASPAGAPGAALTDGPPRH
jgi:hypothetical protein